MRQNKVHKKDQRPKRKDNVEDRFHHGRPNTNKVKYRHKYHWLDEEEVDIVNIKIKRTVKH